MGRWKGSRTGDSKGKNKRDFKCKCDKCSEFGLGTYSRKLSAFGSSKSYLSQDTRNYNFLWWSDLDMSCHEIMDTK